MTCMRFKDISIEQKKPLDYKIQKAVEAIKSGFEVCQSKAAIAFSGGKDSTVLWHLIREHFPEQAASVAILFGNTGVEYPESLKFARELGIEWGKENFYEVSPAKLEKDEYKYEAQRQILDWLMETGNIGKVLKADGKLKTTQALEKACPPHLKEEFYTKGLVWKKGTIKSYWWCVDQYGYPILGKAASKLKARRINIDCFLRFSNSTSEKEELKEYYDVLRTTKISQACCDILKKEPAERIKAELKVDVIFKGLMAAESQTRKINFSTRGYLFETSRKHIDTPFYHCNPISIWTDDDIWEYIKEYNVPYSQLYDLTYKDNKGNTCKIKRNGCIGCFTDYGRKNSHMMVLRQTHPKHWEAVMRYGMAKEISHLRAHKKYSRPTIIDALAEVNGEEFDRHLSFAIEDRPCAFD